MGHLSGTTGRMGLVWLGGAGRAWDWEREASPGWGGLVEEPV